MNFMSLRSSIFMLLTQLFPPITEPQQLLSVIASDWKTIKDSDSIYYIGKGGLTWIQALQFCGQRGGHLVSLENRKEETQLLALIPIADSGRYEYWSSGTNILKNYIWMGTGQTFKGNYYNFCSTDLITLWNDDHCVALNDRRNCWQTRNCDSILRFICEISPNVYM